MDDAFALLMRALASVHAYEDANVIARWSCHRCCHYALAGAGAELSESWDCFHQ